MKYDKAYKAIKLAQEQLNITSKTKTQAGRKNGATFAENGGASSDN